MNPTVLDEIHREPGRQLDFDLFGESVSTHSPIVAAAIDKLSMAAGMESLGAIFTRTEVVNFILDLAGYTEDQPLHEKRLLEPSFGGGDFLLPAIGRLLTAWKSSQHAKTVVEELGDAIRAVELHRKTFSTTRAAVIERLKQEEIEDRSAVALADRWLGQGDFLLTPFEGQFDFVRVCRCPIYWAGFQDRLMNQATTT